MTEPNWTAWLDHNQNKTYGSSIVVQQVKGLVLSLQDHSSLGLCCGAGLGIPAGVAKKKKKKKKDDPHWTALLIVTLFCLEHPHPPARAISYLLHEAVSQLP